MKLSTNFLYLLIVLAGMASGKVLATNYYVDFTGGNDNNTGTSTSQAWQNLTKVNDHTFSPADTLFLKYGSVWNDQQLWPKGSGSVGSPIVIDAYGDPGDGRPILNGNGAVVDVVYLYNQEWIEIRNLEITNYKPGDLIDDPESFKRGIYIGGKDFGELTHIHMVNLYIHSVNGYGVGANAGKDCGGIFFEITGTSVPSWYNDFLIEGCHIRDVIRTGISSRSTWKSMDSGTWHPFLNVKIRNTIMEEAGFNGMIPRNALNMIIEYCTFINNGIHGNGNAIFQWVSDSTVYQYNEAYGTVFNPEDHDAAGFDGGGYNTNTLMQYNYSHDNGLGGIVIGLGSGAPNDGARIRYNILQDNLRQTFRFSGLSNNVTVSNNTVYIGPEISDVNIIFHKKLTDSPDNLFYFNNLFYILGKDCYYSFGESTNYRFTHNAFFGKHPSTEPGDHFKITDDPLLMAPGTGGIGRNSVSGYKLMPGSPCINAGLPSIGNNGGFDYWGHKVPHQVMPDIGAHEWYGDTVEVLIVVYDELQAPVEGAFVWVEGTGSKITGSDGTALFSNVLTGQQIPVIVDLAGYPPLSGSIDASPDDTVTVTLSKDSYDLRFILSDTTGTLLENVEVTLPGIDTLISNSQGEILFAGITESENIMYKTEIEGFHFQKGTLKIDRDDTAAIQLLPRSVFFEVLNKDNAPLEGVSVKLGSHDPQQTDARGIATVKNVSVSEKVYYTIEKPGWWPQKDSMAIGNENSSVLARLEPTQLSFQVVDTESQPIPAAAIVFLDKLSYTNEDGIAEFAEVPVGNYLSYSVYHSGYITATDSIAYNY